MGSFPPPPHYFMPEPHHHDTSSVAAAASSYFDFYHPPPYPTPSATTSPASSSSHFPSPAPAAPPYELLKPHLLTPPPIIPTPSPSASAPQQQQQQQPQQQINFVFPMSEYSLEQMEAICTSLFQAKDGARLVAFFKQLESVYGGVPLEHFRSETIIVAYTYALYHSNDFENLFQLLSTRAFHQNHYSQLQEIWHHARYKESQLKRGKELNPVEKYRLRRKFPPPKTIWDGEETVYSFKESQRKYLLRFYKDTNPYPTQEQKKEIANLTGLKMTQISNWFKNRRQRDKPNGSGKCSPPSSSSSTNNDFPPLITPQNFSMAAAAAGYNMPMFYDTTR